MPRSQPAPIVDWVFHAVVSRWIDGDTLVAMIDSGWRNYTRQTLRLYSVDTPERGEPGYAEAKARVNEIAPPGTKIIVRSYKAEDVDRHGRWLAEVWVGDLNVARLLLAEDLATPYFLRAT